MGGTCNFIYLVRKVGLSVMSNYSRTSNSGHFYRGHQGQVAVIERWPLFRGGRYSEVVAIQRWSLFRGGRYSEVVAIHRFTTNVL